MASFLIGHLKHSDSQNAHEKTTQMLTVKFRSYYGNFLSRRKPKRERNIFQSRRAATAAGGATDRSIPRTSGGISLTIEVVDSLKRALAAA